MEIKKAVKIYKKIKIILIIIAIIVAIMCIIGLFFILDEEGIIDLDKLLLDGEEETSYSSDKVEAILQAADKIDFYISTGSDSGQHGYTYTSGPFNLRYNSGNYKGSCCATYVSWILQEVGLVEDSEHFDWVPTAEAVLSSKSEWKKVYVSDLSDMKPGDVGFYRMDISISLQKACKSL